MKQNIFNIKLFVMLCACALSFISCVEENTFNKEKDNTGKSDIPTKLTSFVSGSTKTRASLDYAAEKWFWENGDKIYVKDEDGNWQSGTVDEPHKENYTFMLSGRYLSTKNYTVYFPGHPILKNDDPVTIHDIQGQIYPTKPYFSQRGNDFGIGTAKPQIPLGETKYNFYFTLRHPTSILVFEPTTSNPVLKNCTLTQIEAISDNNICGTYTLDPTTYTLVGSGSGKTVKLRTPNAVFSPDGFPLNYPDMKVYMVIAPGTHKLTVRYQVRDVANNVEGIITKTYPAFTYAANSYYDMPVNLDIKDYSTTGYYMWDAQQNYWWGKEDLQPTIPPGPGAFQGPYPTSKASDPQRWYNESYPGNYIRNDAQTAHFKTLPNANEMAWYCVEGDPHWDKDQLWTTMGKLHKGGMWFKKKAKILADEHINATQMQSYHRDNGGNIVDFRTNRYSTGHNAIIGTPQNLTDYFFLPASTYYSTGILMDRMGVVGDYWSSSAVAYLPLTAYYMYFTSSSVVLAYTGRDFGFRVQPFE